MNVRPVRRARGIGMLLAGGALLVAPHANAQIAQRFALRGEGGVGLMLPTFQNNSLEQHILVQGHLHAAFNIIDPLAIQVSFGSWYFPGNGSGQVYSLLGGLRFEPRISRAGRLFIDAGLGLGQTADMSRLTLEAGVGFEFDVLRFLALGPVVRYGHVFHTDGDVPSDAMYLSFGLSITLRIPPPPPPPETHPTATDVDGDGIPDAQDICPHQPAGEHPDPDAARHGCPALDSDHDGVIDRDDQCPHQAQGEHPDPDRRGCPAPDADGDGVFDRNDLCPTTAAGPHPDPHRAGCPDGDDDGDHVLNQVDQCPQQAQGINPDPARPGCPQADRDRDNVPDPVDACPDQPGAPNADPRRNGCSGLVIVENGTIRILQPVHFARGSDRILPQSLPLLNAIATALRIETGIHRMSIDGHTDDVGDDAANLDLSQRRATSVMTWLTTHGIAAERLEAHGYGETRPIMPGTTRQARAANRRVEFHIIDPPTDAPVQPVTTTNTTTTTRTTRSAPLPTAHPAPAARPAARPPAHAPAARPAGRH